MSGGTRPQGKTLHRPMAAHKDILLGKLRAGESLGGREQLALTMLLALPAILAQLSMCLMSYIDAAMVGRLGSAQAAAIGLVSTTTWIFGSFCYANSSGFTVQIAHRCGARDFAGARKVFRYGLSATVLFSITLTVIGMSVSTALPTWLGGGEDIRADASAYFRIYTLFLPVFQVAVISEASLIASGNIKVPAAASLMMCLLDVAFNYLFIFVMDMGAKGAALGTGAAELCAAAFLLAYVVTRSPELKRPCRPAKDMGADGSAGAGDGSDWKHKDILHTAFGITWPLWLQNLVTRGAYIAATVIIAPLGTVAIAANSFAIIAEGFCYLPGYGMQDAATTLVGQSLGAGRKDMARRFARITIGSGAAMMGVLAVLMYAFAPSIMGMLSKDPAVIALGAQCLRVEAWAELLFGVSIVAYGCCVGAGDTLVPSLINLLSMWVIRIGVALLLIPRVGLVGYWVGMAVELSAKGVIIGMRVHGNSWLRKWEARKTPLPE